MSDVVSSFEGLASPDAARRLGAAAILGIAGITLLLPRSKGRSVALGTFLSLASATVAVSFIYDSFGRPAADLLGDVIFWFFAAGAVIFGGMLVVQHNPARGAMAFAFVILSSCGLFLQLAAPFLAAAIVIVYAGAIIVTFLFVLMLSHANGPSDENDRSREPLLGALAGFAFIGLVLFALRIGTVNSSSPLPAPPLTQEERLDLKTAVDELDLAAAAKNEEEIEAHLKEAVKPLTRVLGCAIGEGRTEDQLRKPLGHRLRSTPIDRRTDPRLLAILDRAAALTNRRKIVQTEMDNLDFGGKLDPIRAELRSLRDEIVLFSGQGLLPARNVAAIGVSLYSDHLIAVEMAGTLLLIATIGAVAIARRKGRAA